MSWFFNPAESGAQGGSRVTLLTGGDEASTLNTGEKVFDLFPTVLLSYLFKIMPTSLSESVSDSRKRFSIVFSVFQPDSR